MTHCLASLLHLFPQRLFSSWSVRVSASVIPCPLGNSFPWFYFAWLAALAGFRYIYRHEEAFRLELVLTLLAPLSAFLISGRGLGALIAFSARVLVMMVEALNSAVEVVVDSSDDPSRNVALIAQVDGTNGTPERFNSSKASMTYQRNIGLESVCSDVVLFPDDDSLLQP